MFNGIKISKISYHLPEKIQTNHELNELNPNWDIGSVEIKTGIYQRHIAEENITSLDLGYEASLKLFRDYKIAPKEINALFFVSQSGDYALPPSSCILQEKLFLNKNLLALDINLGCSGFVNTLALAASTIKSGSVENCLIICAETYSKYISNKDRTNKLIFSDGAAACLVEKDPRNESAIGAFCFGCDGKGAKELIVKGSGARGSLDLDEQKLYMNGPAILLFTLSQVPDLLKRTLIKNKLDLDDIDLFIFHQASKMVIDLLSEKIGIPSAKMYSNLRNIGNTVSCTIPIALKDAELEGKLKRNNKILIIGFGVGYSLGATVITW